MAVASNQALITESHLTNIANAIRTKRNYTSSTKFYPSEMASEILGITTLAASVSGTTLILTGEGASASNSTATIGG